MRVLHVAGGSPSDGAGRGVLWLHRALRRRGVESCVVFQRSDGPEAGIVPLTDSLSAKARQSLRSHGDNLPLRAYPSRSGLFSSGFVGNDVRALPGYADADVVHLHWVNQAMLSIGSIGRIDKPWAWTVRDMWPFTGGCHYSLDCDSYRTRCGRCPVLGSTRERDLSTLVQHRKRRAFAARPPHLVAISEWVAECVRASAVFGDRTRLSTIPNGVDTEAYFPVDKRTAKSMLGIPEDRRVVLCGAQSLGAAYKGLSVFLDAADRVDVDCLFVFFGRPDPSIAGRLGERCRQLGFLHDTLSLRVAYSAADVFVAPSLQEAFGKTLVEAFACGTPVVCFDATGPRDIVEHRENGYRAVPGDADDLARGVEHVLGLDGTAAERMGASARRRVLERFSVDEIAGRYVEEVYGKLLGAPRVEPRDGR